LKTKQSKAKKNIYTIYSQKGKRINKQMNPFETAVSNYRYVIQFSAYAFTGWLSSWILFFIIIPFMVQCFGKVKGMAFNYAFSWASMIIIILGLEFWFGGKNSEILKHITSTRQL
jgi:hypothetical protein